MHEILAEGTACFVCNCKSVQHLVADILSTYVIQYLHIYIVRHNTPIIAGANRTQGRVQHCLVCGQHKVANHQHTAELAPMLFQRKKLLTSALCQRDSIMPKKTRVWVLSCFKQLWFGRLSRCLLISSVIVHYHLLQPVSPCIILFHSLHLHLSCKWMEQEAWSLFPQSNFTWLYLDTFHFLCRGRQPASHNPEMQPSIDLHERTRGSVECPSNARGSSEESVFS